VDHRAGGPGYEGGRTPGAQQEKEGGPFNLGFVG
jgi:hypothetical protein